MLIRIDERMAWRKGIGIMYRLFVHTQTRTLHTHLNTQKRNDSRK